MRHFLARNFNRLVFPVDEFTFLFWSHPLRNYTKRKLLLGVDVHHCPIMLQSPFLKLPFHIFSYQT